MTFRYETSFIQGVTHDILFIPFYKIKSQETDLKPEQSLFVECINQMLNVKQSILVKSLGLNFDKLKIYKQSQRMDESYYYSSRQERTRDMIIILKIVSRQDYLV